MNMDTTRVLALVLSLVAVASAANNTAKSCVKDGLETSCQEDVAGILLSLQDQTYETASQMEVVLLVDEGGLEANQHYWVKQLLLIISDIFIVSPKHTLVSVVTYGSVSRRVVAMTSDGDVCSLTRNITSMNLQPGESYLSQGIDSALAELNSVKRPSSTKRLTILLTPGDWRNLGADPQGQIRQLTQNGDYLAVIILNFPNQKLGLVRHVISDFASHFGSQKLSFTVELTPLYLRKLQQTVQYNKAIGKYWPLELAVDSSRCLGDGRRCGTAQTCVCDVRTVLKEYICVSNKDTDPPEAVSCEGPASPIKVSGGNTSAVVSWPPPLFTDNAGTVQTWKSDRIPGIYQLGSYTVISSARDAAGNVGTCTFSFTVQQ